MTHVKIVFILITLCLLSIGACNKASHKEVSVSKVKEAPKIDGRVDKLWENCKWMAIKNVRWTRLAKVSKTDISAFYKILWDADNCYFLFSVKDDIKFENTFTTEFEKKFDLRLRDNDGVELFFDPLNTKQSGIDVNNFNYKKFTYDSDSISTSTSTPVNSVVEGIVFAQSDTKTGYIFEIKLPWKVLGINPEKGSRIGLEVNVVDNDNDVPQPDMLSEKEAIITWNNDTYENPFNQTDIYGTLILNDK